MEGAHHCQSLTLNLKVAKFLLAKNKRDKRF